MVPARVALPSKEIFLSPISKFLFSNVATKRVFSAEVFLILLDFFMEVESGKTSKNPAANSVSISFLDK